jgi:hypothetical protein
VLDDRRLRQHGLQRCDARVDDRLVFTGGEVLVVAAWLAVPTRVAQPSADFISLGRPQLVELFLARPKATSVSRTPTSGRTPVCVDS